MKDSRHTGAHLGEELLANSGPPVAIRFVHEIVLEELHAREHVKDGLLAHPLPQGGEIAPQAGLNVYLGSKTLFKISKNKIQEGPLAGLNVQLASTTIFKLFSKQKQEGPFKEPVLSPGMMTHMKKVP